jgi:choline transport protein
VTVFGWQSVAASSGYLLAVIIQGILLLTRPEYVPKSWHTVLLFWALSAFAVLINSTTSRFLARFEGTVLILHLVGFFCVLIPMVYLGPHASAKDVFTVFANTGGWSSQGLSFLVGMPASVFCLMGADSAVHVSYDECSVGMRSLTVT